MKNQKKIFYNIIWIFEFEQIVIDLLYNQMYKWLLRVYNEIRYNNK
jgi:hypothetical protein